MFQGPGRREVVASFDGGRISTEGGALLLCEVDRRVGILGRFAACFDDHRSAEWVEHSVEEHHRFTVRNQMFDRRVLAQDADPRRRTE